MLATALAVARGTQAQPVAPAPTTGFVRREGTRFVLAGAPFRFVGANVSVTHGPTQRAALDRVLDAVAEDGLRVVRVWALGEYPTDAPPWARDYAWRLGPEGWVEETAIHLDRVLDAARARGLRVVLVLGNRWADYGGATRYLQWAGLRAPDATGALSATELGGLFRDATAEGLYRAHVARVVGRVSSTTADPTATTPRCLPGSSSTSPRPCRATATPSSRGHRPSPGRCARSTPTTSSRRGTSGTAGRPIGRRGGWFRRLTR